MNKKAIFLFSFALALGVNGYARPAMPGVAKVVTAQGRQVINLSGSGWHLMVDKKASWRDDHLFPPSEIKNLADLPVNPPTGGWQALNANNISVAVPGTVEEYTATTDHPRTNDYLGVSWWYRDIHLPQNLTGKRVVLHFESCRFRAEVYLDGKLVAYDVVSDSPFSADITDAVQGGGKHQLAVRVTNPGGQYHWQDYQTFKWGKYDMPPGRCFGGVTGPVTINITDQRFVDDLYMQNTAASDSVNAITTIINNVYKGGKVQKAKANLVARIKEKATGKVVWNTTVKANLNGDTTLVTIPVKLANAKIWDLDHPNLYTCEVELKQGKNMIDNTDRTFGFRSFILDGIGKNAMPRLNGNRMMLRTAISWGFFPETGLVPKQDAAEKQIKTAKGMGLNMLNFHRCIGKPTVLNAADSLGLLYFEEPGAWQVCYKSPFCREILNEKLHRMIKRDRSHPSLVIYCLINEMGGFTTKDKKIMDTRKADMGIAHAIDPSRTMVLTSGWAGREDADEDAKAHFRPFDMKLYRRGWWDNHRAAGPMTWQEDYYQSPTKGFMYSTNDTEIYMRGEEGALTSPPRLELIHQELQKTGRYGWDGKFWETEYQKLKKFFDEKGLKENFGTIDNLTRSLGDISFEHQGRRIQGMRMFNRGDIYAINGWEEQIQDNHSGVVDLHRNPKGNLNTIYRFTQPVYVAVCPRHQVVKTQEQVAVDFYMVNEKNVKGNCTLSMTLVDKEGKTLWTGKKDCQIKGGDVFGQLINENVQVPLGVEDGMYRINAKLTDASGKEVASGYDEVLALSENAELKGKGALYGFKDDKVATYYQKAMGKQLPYYTSKMGKLDWLVINRPLLDEPVPLEDKFLRNMKVKWYADNDFRNYAGEETATGVSRTFADGAQPASCVPANQSFSAQWEGELIPDETGLYMIGVDTDRGARLYVNNVQLIDKIRNNGDFKESRPVDLVKGQPVKIRVEYSQTKQTGRLQLKWSRPSNTLISVKELMDRVKNDGTKLIVLGSAEAWMKDICTMAGVKYKGYFAVGQNWVGGTQYVRNHPVLKGLPTNVGMNWPYQQVVRTGDLRFGFRLEGETQIAGCYKNAPFELGTSVGEISYGKGKILFSTLDIVDNLLNPAGPANVARKLFSNYINY